jgi:tetratricopeptide (TPR) repeat protein
VNDDPDRLIAEARRLRRAGETEAALELLDRADQVGLGGDPARRAAARMERGWALTALRRWPDAHAAFADAAAAAPDDLQVRTWHGRALYNVERDAEAEVELRAVLARDRDRWMAWSFLADLCLIDGRDREAMDAFSEVLRIDADNGYAHYQRGRLRAQAGDDAGAAEDRAAAARSGFDPADIDEDGPEENGGG